MKDVSSRRAGVRERGVWVGKEMDSVSAAYIVEQRTSLAGEKGVDCLAVCYHGNSPKFGSWDSPEAQYGNLCPVLIVNIFSQEPVSVAYPHLELDLATLVERKDFHPVTTGEYSILATVLSI